MHDDVMRLGGEKQRKIMQLSFFKIRKEEFI